MPVALSYQYGLGSESDERSSNACILSSSDSDVEISGVPIPS